MKKLIGLAIFIGLIVFLISSCPDKEAHKLALSDDVTELVNDELTSLNIDNSLTETSEFKTLINGLAVAAVDVDNYFLFSIGKVDLGEKEQVVSFGIGGFVITFNDEIVKQVAELVNKYN